MDDISTPWHWCDEHLAAHGPDTPVYRDCRLVGDFSTREEAEEFGASTV